MMKSTLSELKSNPEGFYLWPDLLKTTEVCKEEATLIQLTFLNWLGNCVISEEYDKFDVFTFLSVGTMYPGLDYIDTRTVYFCEQSLIHTYGFYYLNIELNNICCNICRILTCSSADDYLSADNLMMYITQLEENYSNK